MDLRRIAPADFPAILALNEESVHFLSALTPARLAHLHEQSALGLVVEQDGAVVAFLLAFREGADYDSVNYQWFASRYPRFLYIDRVVVASTARSAGVGSLLYRETFAHAARSGVALVTCEFDVAPPNPVSERFHARFGFHEVGRQSVTYADKWVSLQAADAAAR